MILLPPALRSINRLCPPDVSQANWRLRYLGMSPLAEIFTEIFLPHPHRNGNSFFVTTHATIMKAMPLNVYRSSWIPGVGAV